MRISRYLAFSFALFFFAVLPASAAGYHLEVSHGSGSGDYAAGTDVAVIADAAPAGQVFDKWMGDNNYVIDASDPSTIFTVPESDVVLIATYKDSDSKYTLDVTDGSGSGEYAVDAKVTVSANQPPAGKVFDRWSGNVECVASFYSATTTVTMPARDIELVARYKDEAAGKYTLTVSNGSGSGTYEVGAEVSITASTPAYGKDFDQWTGDIGFVHDFYASSTKVTIPESNISVTAAYKDNGAVLYKLTVTSGTGSGSYMPGEKITIKANAPASGKVFYRWTGDTSYISSATSATATVTIPKSNLSLTATYKSTVTNPTTPATPTTPSGGDGTLIKTAASSKVYVMIGGKKKWIPTPEVFEQLGYAWTSIKVLSEAELAKIPDYEDNLIRLSGDTKIYLVVNGIKRHIPNPVIFQDYGFSWDEVKDVDRGVIDKYKTAFLIRASKEPEVYYLKEGIRKFIPTLEIFNSYGDRMEDVQIISKMEMASYPVTNLVRLKGSTDIYLIEGRNKRKILNVTVFDRYNFDWDNVIDVNQTELSYYATGEPLT